MEPTHQVVPLEPRRLLAAPFVQSVHFLGSEQHATGIVVTFSSALDPATAQNPKAYFAGRKVTNEPAFDFFGLIGPETETKKINIVGAAYDDATHSVTLSPAKAFNARDRFRRLKVKGKGDLAVRDAAGVALDGNGDGKPGDGANIPFRLTVAEKLDFDDADDDRINIKLSGPGKIVAIRAKNRHVPPILFLNKSNATRSTLNGFVSPRKQGDGVAIIQQVSGVQFASVPLLDNPSFVVNLVDP